MTTAQPTQEVELERYHIPVNLILEKGKPTTLYLSTTIASVDDDRTPVDSIAIAGSKLIFYTGEGMGTYVIDIEDVLQAACHKITELESDRISAVLDGPDRRAGAEGGVSGPSTGNRDGAGA